MPGHSGLVEAINETAQTPLNLSAIPASQPLTGIATFIGGANRLDKAGHTDAALDLLYDAVDEMLCRGAFGKVDAILHDANVAELSINILIGLLTVTLPARSRLPSRTTFFARVDDIVHRRGEFEEGLLTGLEG